VAPNHWEIARERFFLAKIIWHIFDLNASFLISKNHHTFDPFSALFDVYLKFTD